MLVKGKVSGVETKERNGAVLTTFRIRSEDGRETQAETSGTAALREGSSVQVDGTINSELVLIANSITPLDNHVGPVKMNWKLIALGGVALVVILGFVGWFATKSDFTPQTGIRFEYPNVSPPLTESSAKLCEQACQKDAQCAKYTWVRSDGILTVSKVYGHLATCWLLPAAATQSTPASDVLMGVQPSCCISAAKK